jgi:hypothetical protein
MTTRAAGSISPTVSSRTFSTSKDASRFLQSRVPGFSEAWSDTKNAALMNDLGIIAKEPVEDPPPPGGYPVLAKRFRWVIRNDDLNLLDCILEGLRGTASAGFFFAAGVSAPAEWGAVVGLAAALFKVWRSVLRRGQELSPDLFSVLVALKNGGPATTEELAARLLKTDPKWSGAAVQSILDALKSLPMSDGTVRQLVAKGYNEQWQVSGL